jgi:hypothetical protein
MFLQLQECLPLHLMTDNPDYSSSFGQVCAHFQHSIADSQRHNGFLSGFCFIVAKVTKLTSATIKFRNHNEQNKY